MTNKLAVWLETRRNASTMLVTASSLEGIAPWGYRENSEGSFEYSREDGKFFRLGGFLVKANREVPGWTQPMLEELTGPGVIVLVTDGERFIVTAREEPGNSPNKKHMLLGPTLQASESNLQAAHGGKAPPRAELYSNEKVQWFVQPGDGGRYFNKTNRVGILQVEPQSFNGELMPNETWASKQELIAAFSNGDVNPHLAECLAVALLIG